MPKPAKTLDNMTKHLTKTEQSVRAAAESAVMPTRDKVRLKPPAYIRSDKRAAKYWHMILGRMEGISLLDDLDTEILAVYCSMLSRRDAAQALLESMLMQAEEEKADEEIRMAILGMMVKLQGQERAILQYAEKLGFTPSGRVHLARKRAEKAAGQVGDEDDLFGD